MLYRRAVFDNQVIILAQIDLRTLPYFAQLLPAPALLYADMLVHLRLENAELIHFSLICHAQFPVTACPAGKTGPEIRELIDYHRVVTNGLPQVSDTVVQQRTIVNGHEILRLHLHNEVEISYSTVVVAKLNAQQSAVIVCKKITRIEVNCKVIIGHCTPKVVQIQSCKGTVYIVFNDFWTQMNHTRKAGIGRSPLPAVQGNI